MRFLIVDDDEGDRASLARGVRKICPEVIVAEASNVKEMYGGLALPCDLLFQDVALNPQEETVDSEGLHALYDVVESYPSLPIVVVTGHFQAKAAEILSGGIAKRKCLVDYLDKGTFGKADLIRAIERAAEYRAWRQEEEAKEDFVEEVFAEAYAEAEKHYSDEVKASKAYLEAFSGDDWVVRAEAEARLSHSGHVNGNALMLCPLIERIVKTKCMAPREEATTFDARLRWLASHHELGSAEQGLVMRAWRVRNKLVHAEKSAYIQDVELLARALEIVNAI